MNPTIINTINSLNVKEGGTSRLAIDLVRNLSNYPDLICFLLERKGLSALEGCQNGGLKFKLGIPFKNKLVNLINNNLNIIIHTHGIWLPVNYWSSYYARKFNIPIIIQTHGMLQPWALNHNGFKKRLAMILYQFKNIKNANCLVATSISEYQAIRQLGFKNPIAIIPNAINLSDVSYIKDIKKNKTVLFLSRIHPVKGIENLIHAWNACNKNGWNLCIAGSGSHSYEAELKSLVFSLGLQDSVSFVGEVSQDMKSGLYQSAELFVLPSFSENFGIVVCEALSYGLPVITTKGTPWDRLVDFSCGWWIDIGVEPLVEALNSALSMDNIQRKNMSNQAVLCSKFFDWDVTVNNFIELYLWLLNLKNKPSFVLLD